MANGGPCSVLGPVRGDEGQLFGGDVVGVVNRCERVPPDLLILSAQEQELGICGEPVVKKFERVAFAVLPNGGVFSEDCFCQEGRESLRLTRMSEPFTKRVGVELGSCWR